MSSFFQSHCSICDFHLLNACLNCATKKSINKGVIDRSAQLSEEEDQSLVLPKSSRTQRKVRGEFIIEYSVNVMCSKHLDQ